MMPLCMSRFTLFCLHLLIVGFGISMADVTYNTSSFPALIRTISTLIRTKEDRGPPLLLLGYKERDPAERMLWDMMKDIGFMLEMVGKRKGAGGASVEVWVGSVHELALSD
jgi:hypothetical protein